MTELFKKYGWFLIYIVAAFFAVSWIFSLLWNDTIVNKTIVNDVAETTISTPAQQRSATPKVQADDFIINNLVVELNGDFNYEDLVTVTATNGDDISSYVTCSESYQTTSDHKNHKIDASGNLLDDAGNVIGKVSSTSGEHKLLYILNWNGIEMQKYSTIFVRPTK